MLAGFVETWNRADGEGHRDLYWPDAELVDPLGAIVDGRDAITALQVELWGSILEGSVIAGRIRSLRVLGPSHLIADLDIELSGFSDLPAGVPRTNGIVRNRLKHVMEQRNGIWKILSAQNTALTPESKMRRPPRLDSRRPPAL